MTRVDFMRSNARFHLGARRGLTAALSVLLALGLIAAAPQTASAEPSLTQLSGDSFTRADRTGWGATGTGQTYSFTGQTDPLVISSSRGLMRNLRPGSSSEAFLPAVSVRDVLVQSIVTVPSNSASSLNLHHALEARRQVDGTAYRGRVHFRAGGIVMIGASRTAGSSETGLGSVKAPFAVAAGEQIKVQVQVTGTSPVAISVRAWKVGATIPGWQFTTADSSGSRISSAGTVGIWDYVSSSSVVTTVAHDEFNSFQVASASAPPPTTLTAPAVASKVYRSANFDNWANGAVVPSNFIASLGSTNSNASAYDDMSVVADSRGNGKVIRTKLRAGTIHSKPGSDNGNNFFVALPTVVDKACIAYDIKFDSNFDWSLGGKLPGLEGVAPGVSPSTPTGGGETQLGWSGRAMWLTPKSYGWAGPTNMGLSYMYHSRQSSTWGDNERWNKSFVAGRWHNVKQCYAMNTVGQANGQLKAWFDGVQVINNSSYVYRSRNDVRITHMIFSVFRGGGTLDWAGSRDSYIDIDNVKITSA